MKPVYHAKHENRYSETFSKDNHRQHGDYDLAYADEYDDYTSHIVCEPAGNHCQLKLTIDGGYILVPALD